MTMMIEERLIEEAIKIYPGDRGTRAFVTFVILLCGSSAQAQNRELTTEAKGAAAKAALEALANPEQQTKILRGDNVSVAEQQRIGLVTVNDCSGVLLNPEWAITAGHC